MSSDTFPKHKDAFPKHKDTVDNRRNISPMKAYFYLMFLLFALALTLPLHAQISGKGTLTGTITDKTGAVIPGANIVATNTANGISTTSTSTGSGSYTFAALDPGIYTLAISAQGFQKLVQQNLHVNALEMLTFNPAMTVGAVDAQITVTDVPPQLETSNATLGAVLENETYSELPIQMGAYGQADQRRATDFAFLMPGVQGNNTNGNATTNTGVVNGSGSRGAASAVYVDGIVFVRAGGNGDPRYVWTAVSVDAVDQFQVQTVGYSAVYEGQGVMNYTIKQGGLKYKGSVYEFLRNTAFDTWGWFKATNPANGQYIKPPEHNNEYGINISGPLIPLRSLRQKLFFYGNYNGFRYSSQKPVAMTWPTMTERAGDFRDAGIAIYDPLTQAQCTANSNNGPCRYQYGYQAGSGTGANGNPVPTGLPVNVIPASEFSSVALQLQNMLPAVNSTAVQNNYIAPNPTSLNNWSTTERIDYNMLPSDTLTLIAAIGRQASSVPVGQTTAGRNVGVVPYNYGQAYAPKTAVGVIEETHTFSPHLINQFKWGYARYNGPTFTPNEQPAYAATAMGIAGANIPSGPAQNMFPIVTFTGANAPTNWGGTTPNLTLAANFTLMDSVQWNIGKHAFTFGGQIAWMQYNTVSATGGSTPLTLAYNTTETAGIKPSSNAKPAYAAISGTGLAYASFLIGQTDKLSFTDYHLKQEYGARFRAISPYVQDNWKINSKLTLDAGLRYDFFPSITEVNNAQSFFNPNLANPITGINGALEFTGKGSNTCNCSSPVSNSMKNWGPRIGVAYQVDSKTVIRSSWGIMFTHGNAVGGLNTSLGTLGFSSAPSFSANGQMLSTAPFTGHNGVTPTYTSALGLNSGPAYGTGYTTTTGYTGTPSSGMNYNDRYLGSRAPEYINWSFGLQRQIVNQVTINATYVGAEGHFVQADGSNIRGYWADQLDPKWLYLGTSLNTAATAANCVSSGAPCPANFTTSQNISQALKPFPFQSVSDNFNYSANTNYHSLQIGGNIRSWHGYTLNVNYTWAKAIDDAGQFRTGYAIPAGYVANEPGKAYKQDAIERSLSTTSQPQHLVLTSVWSMPFGKTILNTNSIERAILGGFKLSGVFQSYSGSPLAITGSSCQTNPAQSNCAPTLNPNFAGRARQNGKWGNGVNITNYNNSKNPASYFITPSACAGCVAATSTTSAVVGTPVGPFVDPNTLLNTAYAPAFTFGNASRTAPYNLYSPGNYQLDFSLVRSFPLHITEATKLDIRAEWYNVTNHTFFAVASTAVGNSSFGQITSNASANLKSAQFAARLWF